MKEVPTSEGSILLGRLLNCEAWGCALYPYRAKNAATRMDICHSATRDRCSLTDESVTLLWLNAPTMATGTATRSGSSWLPEIDHAQAGARRLAGVG